MQWFKRKKEAISGNISENAVAIISSSPQENSTGSEAVLKNARDLLLKKGPAWALEYLRDSQYVKSESVIRMMHAVVWNNHQRIPNELLEEDFLDPIWCQCILCQNVWLLSPLLLSLEVGQNQEPNAGRQCSSCSSVLCPNCFKVADASCSCGGTYVGLLRPNGRIRQMQPVVEPQQDEVKKVERWSSLMSNIPIVYPKNIDLYFGFEGQVPIGIDSSFPIDQKSANTNHLRWAEILLDEGIYYQAQQQLDLLKEPDTLSGQVLWLRARLLLVRLHNARERSRRRLDQGDLDHEWLEWPQKIKQWLADATQHTPEFGPAWLTTTQVYLNPACGQDFGYALQCAEHALALLGKTTAVLMAYGQALRGVGRAAEAVDVLRDLLQMMPDSEEKVQVQRELDMAELEARCQTEPVDVESHLRLGRWCLLHDHLDKAHQIFTRLVDRCPEHAEGYFGMGRLAFIGYKNQQSERMTEAYRLCRQALAFNPHFGLAYELLGSIFRNVGFSREAVNFAIEDPLDCYRRALQYDSTCDIAHWLLAEDYIDRGQLQPAIEHLEKAASLDTRIASVFGILAVIYRGTRQFEKEKWTMQQAKDLSPDTVMSAEYANKILSLCGFEY